MLSVEGGHYSVPIGAAPGLLMRSIFGPRFSSPRMPHRKARLVKGLSLGEGIENMKVHVEVEMTPEEARTMMGLPDVAPLQQKMLEEMQSRMKAAFDTGDPEAMMRAWMPFYNGSAGAGRAFEQFQKFLWDSLMVAGTKDKA